MLIFHLFCMSVFIFPVPVLKRHEKKKTGNTYLTRTHLLEVVLSLVYSFSRLILTGIELESFLYFHLLNENVNKKQLKGNKNARTEVLKIHIFMFKIASY